MFCAAGETRNLGDPYYHLATFGWTTSSQMRGGPAVMGGLLKAKAISLAFEMPHCPILRELANYGMRITKYAEPIWDVDRYGRLSWWTEQVMANATKLPSADISLASRVKFAERYGISLAKQTQIEKYLRNKDDTLPLPDFELLFPTRWRDYFAKYARTVPAGYNERVIYW